MKKKILITILLINFLTLATTQKILNKIKMEKSEKSNDEKSEQYYLYLKGSFEYQNKYYEKALKTFQELISQNPPIYAYENYIKLLAETMQFQQIVKLPEKIRSAFSESSEVGILIAQAYLFTNKENAAEKLFQKLSEKYPNNEYVAYYTIVSFLQQGKVAKALELIDKALDKKSFKTKHFLFYFLKSKILLQMGQPLKALELAEKSIKLYPKFEKVWLFKALISEQIGKINEAIKGYQHFLDIVGHDSSIERQLIKLLFLQKRYKDAVKVLQKSKDRSPNHFFDLAVLQWKSNNFSAALKNCEEALRLDKQFKQAKLLKIEILLAMNKKAAALDFTVSWIKQNPNDRSALHSLLLLKKANIPKEKIIDLLEQILNEHPKTIILLAAIVDLYMESKNFKEAEKIYKELLSMANNEELKAKINFQLAYIYYIQNKHQVLEKHLQNAIQQKTVYPSTYNLFAYYYAQQGQNLNKALDLINKALENKPSCHYYLDTKGLILLKMGKKEEAKQLFKEALAIEPNDIEIQHHFKLINNDQK